jgi:hypothetical protein
MSERKTISAAYLSQQQELHKNPHYGIASINFAPMVKQIMVQSGAKSLSDYGAGKCRLRDALYHLAVKDFEYFPYDPAFPEYGAAKPADLVCCIDVLEHIEPDFLEAVILDLKGITRRIGLFSVATGPAMKHLPDGRNAHLIQQPLDWWLPQLRSHFEITQLHRGPAGFWVLVGPAT